MSSSIWWSPKIMRWRMWLLYRALWSACIMQLSLCLPARENYALKCSIADNQTPVFKFVFQKKNTKIGDPMWSMYSRKWNLPKWRSICTTHHKRKTGRERERENCSWKLRIVHSRRICNTHMHHHACRHTVNMQKLVQKVENKKGRSTFNKVLYIFKLSKSHA